MKNILEMKISNNDELKMYKVHGINDEAEPRPLVFKISKSMCSSATENLAESLKENFQSDDEKNTEMPSVSATESNNKLSSTNFESAYPGCSKDISRLFDEDGAKSTNLMEADNSLKDGRTGLERRRSLRLLALQSKRKVEQHEEAEKRALNYQVFKKKPKTRKRIKKTSKCNATKDEKSKDTSMNDHNLNYPYADPKTMKLKSMFLLTTPQKPSSFVSESHVIETPRFSNVDPSNILQTLFRQENKKSSFGRPMGVFFTNDVPSTYAEHWVKKRSMRQYDASKKVKYDLSYLCKKYRMLDLITLDNCYGMCHCSLKKTEIMLLDIICGKEIIFSRNEDRQNVNVEYDLVNWVGGSNDVSKFLPDFYQRCDYYQSFENLFSDSNAISRKIIVQSMDILYNEEAVLEKRQ